MGMAHLAKADKFYQEQNFPQLLRYAELAWTKLKQLKDRSLATIQILDKALTLKFDALNFMDHNKEALECATERYNMWATTFMRNPGTIDAASPLIDSLINNGEFDQAHLIASTVHEMAMHPMTHDIPENQQQQCLAQASHQFAHATMMLAQSGGIPPEEEQKVGEEAIALARKAMEINTQLHGANSERVVSDMSTLASVLDHFNDVDDDEAIRLYEQAIAFRSRTQGSSSVNVAIGKRNLGNVYKNRARRAEASNDLNRFVTNGELALSHYHESARIFRAINHVDNADDVLECAVEVEESIREIRIARSAAASSAATRG